MTMETLCVKIFLKLRIEDSQTFTATMDLHVTAPQGLTEESATKCIRENKEPFQVILPEYFDGKDYHRLKADIVSFYFTDMPVNEPEMYLFDSNGIFQRYAIRQLRNEPILYFN